MAQYILSFTISDSNISFVEGPEVPDFQAFCNELVPQAAATVLEKARAKPYHPPVSWNEIVKEIANLLRERGYKVTRSWDLPTADYEYIEMTSEPLRYLHRESSRQQMTLLGNDLAQQIIDYNDSAEAAWRRRRQSAASGEEQAQ